MKKRNNGLGRVGRDTDSDGWSDGEEVNKYKTSPLSTDTDEDDCEIWFDIQQNDYDGDGLTWWEEVNRYHTNPGVFTVVDVDGDGLDGYGERECGSDPSLVDTDGDGLSDYEEFVLGTSPVL